jgi:Arc/MetJ-type ribon-helix-helix transcriptional regulator
MKPTDQFILTDLRKTVWAEMDDQTFDLVVKAVEEAGDIRNTTGYAMTLIQKAVVEKGRFSSRSEAGRYAANVRWQSEGGKTENTQGSKASDRYKNMSNDELNNARNQAEQIQMREADNGQSAGVEVQQRIIDRIDAEIAQREAKNESDVKGNRNLGEGIKPRHQEAINSGEINQIADVIEQDIKSQGKKIPYNLKPYLEAMYSISSVNDNYGLDSGKTILAYSLSNMGTYKGETAKAVKAKLKELLKG